LQTEIVGVAMACTVLYHSDLRRRRNAAGCDMWSELLRQYCTMNACDVIFELIDCGG
jgi:hypothetical protein